MKTIKIGRSHSNDCVFSNQSVSGAHAELIVDKDEQHATLRDLNSTNGTYINNSKNRITTDVKISHSDILRFGTEITTLSAILEKANKTKIVGNGKNLPGTDRRTIGKSSDNQIVLNHDDVSRKHAILYKDAQGNIVIEDVGSTNGTFVNGIRITSKVLQPGDKVSITRNYPLQWESIFSPSKPNSFRKTLKFTISISAVILLCIGGYFLWKNQKWDKEKIYKEYHSAVCWVYVQYGYRVLVDGEDFTSTLCELCEIPSANLVHIKDGALKPGVTGAQGTAFFISNDGKLATNLHISRPWLYSDDAQELENGVNKILAYFATQNPMFNRSQIKVEGVMDAMYIIQDGLPISEGNAVECEEMKGHNDTNKDVAILQTKSRELPSRVKSIIDVRKADISTKALAVGKNVFTIGFPYGVDIAMNNNQELKNQVHSGSITQNRGDYEFGHDAETAGGASGSPILDEKGHLIGIHHAGMTGITGAQGFNMAIKAKYILDLLQ